jgi:hypothetical protein
MTLESPVTKGSFSAYPINFLEDKSRYLIAEYNYEDDVLYSTIDDNVPIVPQIGVFEIVDDTTDHVFAKIRNLKLYSDNANISINGTFKLNL